MNFQSAVQTLMGLGLTEVQAKVYVTLATLGVADAKTISQKSLVARPDIYRVMPALSEIGLIETIISTPTKFRAAPAKLAISILLARRNDETKKLRNESKELTKSLENRTKKDVLGFDTSQFAIIPNRKADLKKRILMIRRTLSSQCVISSQERLETLPHLLIQETISALQRGVRLRVVLRKPESTLIITKIICEFKKAGSFEIRYMTENPRVLLLVFDMKESLIVDSAKGYFGQFPDLWTNNTSIVGAIQDYFEILWSTSVVPRDLAVTNSAEQGK